VLTIHDARPVRLIYPQSVPIVRNLRSKTAVV